MPGSSPTRASLAVAGIVLFLAGCGGDPKAEPVPPPAPLATGRATPPLKPGDALPPLQAAGWLNGEPAVPGSPGVKLLVVDLWARWCPFCRHSAPGLVRAYENYSDKGVAFVSLTTMPRDQVEAYVRDTGATWPNGFGVSAEAVAALGAGSGMPGPAEYEIAPTVYLVGPDGKIVWSDGRGRFRHTEPEKWGADLDAAIATALAGPGGGP